ncbi:very short patch repair endonuclease [Archangium violaceum]|uniref:very short patch repair endonuclease n=1 Tax=Archangium violaceum TaxID=83451 RepID=UPI001F39E294|nr:very short patch repair endonuclease [Archangium violaceum]
MKTTRRKGVPPPSSQAAEQRMKAQRSKDTAAELAVRSALHRLGLRFRVNRPVVGQRRKADVVFPSERVAVFIDGCFWHGCPLHATWPKANADFWRAKIEANKARDEATDQALRTAGWSAIRVWEHEDAQGAALRILQYIEKKRAEPRRMG